MKFEFTVEGGDFSNAGTASSKIKRILKQLNVDGKLIKKTVVALYEAEVNIVAHAYRGTITADINSQRIDILLQDEGPGIESIEQAMEVGYSTASDKVREMGFGAGMGLSNMKKNTDVLDLDSKVGKGTKVHIVNYLNNT
ncbi:MAG: ATP-binding protein [Bacteroidales bacterium]|nr:ATP-binding protein [Bacteroidales bacterium]